MTMEQKSRPLNLHSSRKISGREKKPESWCMDLFSHWVQFMYEPRQNPDKYVKTHLKTQLVYSHQKKTTSLYYIH